MKYTRSAALGAASALIVGIGLVALPANAVLPNPNPYPSIILEQEQQGAMVGITGQITIHKFTNPTSYWHDGGLLAPPSDYPLLSEPLADAEFMLCRVNDEYIMADTEYLPKPTGWVCGDPSDDPDNDGDCYSNDMDVWFVDNAAGTHIPNPDFPADITTNEWWVAVAALHEAFEAGTVSADDIKDNSVCGDPDDLPDPWVQTTDSSG
ncbi:MAG: hypothetical protein FWG25_05810, partial [Promicromonosporaceae bacterium]|nr:hypothetical protein [Promicromonosporaceae bacterium]